MQYADRRPIGEEKVIRSVSAQRVRDFYRRWYRPENMAVVAVGDFPHVEVFYFTLFIAAALFCLRSVGSERRWAPYLSLKHRSEFCCHQAIRFYMGE